MKTNFTIAAAAFSLMAVMLFATSCREPEPPKVIIDESSVEVSYDRALMVAKVVDDGGGTITEYGFCYGKEDGTLETLLCNGSKTFSAELTGLSLSTDYTCQAFAVNEAGRGYSELFRFTTMSEMSDTIPKVKTWYVREITHNAAVASGQVLSSGGQTVVERGICYGTELGPTVDGMHVVSGSGMGSFDCPLTDLSPETQYWVRAYAVCTNGVYYGGQLEFNTEPLPMEVRTIGVFDVTATRVAAKGEVVRDGGCEMMECGFCWSTEHEPIKDGLHINANIGVGEFSAYFSGLERGQTHYVRAYAVNEKGVVYGEEVEFIPDDTFTSWSGGSLPGLFSVDKYRQVRFSQGNLQYYPDDDRWRFAEKQWDFVGGTCLGEQIGTMNLGTVYANGAQCDNSLIEKYYEGWIDLFGWGTSGWNNGNTYYQPYDKFSYIFYSDLYGPPGEFDLTDEYAQSDWGVHNTIINGGSRQWRTLSTDEFMFLFVERITPSGIRFAMASVAGVRGMIVLPDDWNESTYYLNSANMLCYYATNTITAREWLEVLEPSGAVFLPAGGDRFQYSGYDGIFFDWFNNEGSYTISFPGNPYLPYYIGGAYWTVSSGNTTTAYVMTLRAWGEAEWLFKPMDRCVGCSVRLVSDE